MNIENRIKRFWAGMSKDMDTLSERIEVYYVLEHFSEIKSIPDYMDYDMPEFLRDVSIPDAESKDIGGD